ncbi:cation efflux protein/ zinc transporter [Diaporthe helianthi]|uniref:Zinc transporter n=1 Tax=Diaporthe helianthi TaxID=158607 RepID=A0A2P5HVJ5_DIAHE|nr:cation efflux protein/ zinc transporter [Diaporthe helianthi]
MASTYVLPGATMPASHRHHDRKHGHSRSRSPSFGSLNRSFKMDSSFGIPSPSLDGEHDHGHSHDHSHDYSHDHSHSHTHSEPRTQHVHHANSMQPRQNAPPPLLPSNGWTTSTTAGKHLITPVTSSFAEQYEAPEAQGTDPPHDHSAERSRFTNMLLPYTSKWPILHAIMTEKDSRRIFYFMSLNFFFMTIQAFYGYITDSLGLLSDSIHMFFDCVALAVGLFASVASKWPPSARFPYGFGKIETLSGFANGVFLVLISVEIMIEAVERIIEGRETKRLAELFIVSSLGLAVNLVGMAAFGHHHHAGHGHDHGCGGHSHGHAESESHSHSHNHTDSHSHSHVHSHSHTVSEKSNHSHEHGHEHSDRKHHDSHMNEHHDHSHSHSHSHSHDNENMLGIYLHVLADTLGSAAVIASTVMTHFVPWSGWDPLASFLIAALIMGSAMPLVKSSARRLLLTIPDDIEYTLRETMSGIPEIPGVASYSVPKFWIDDRFSGDDARAGKMMGVMHVVAVRGADMGIVRDRVQRYLASRNIDVTLQVEREGDGSCWCGVGKMSLTPLTPLAGSQSLKAR